MIGMPRPGEVWTSLRDPARTKTIVSVNAVYDVEFIDSLHGGVYGSSVGALVEYNAPPVSSRRGGSADA